MKLWSFLLLLTLATIPVFANAATPTDASVTQLVSLMGNRHLLDQEMAQMRTIMQRTMKQALAGQGATPEQSKIMEDANRQLMDLMQKHINWDTIQPMMVATYKKNFTQTEVDGMIKFYSSDVGRAVINKMPLVLRDSMSLMQQRIRAMLPKILEIQKASVAKLKATESH